MAATPPTGGDTEPGLQARSLFIKQAHLRASVSNTNPIFQKVFVCLTWLIVGCVVLFLVLLALPGDLCVERDKHKIAAVQLFMIENALQKYKDDLGEYPRQLAQLVDNPEKQDRWRGPYLKKLSKDPWANEFAYSFPGMQREYDLYSYGADGVEGGTDENADIKGW